jgi:hypothetical protein
MPSYNIYKRLVGEAFTASDGCHRKFCQKAWESDTQTDYMKLACAENIKGTRQFAFGLYIQIRNWLCASHECLHTVSYCNPAT